MKIKTFIYDKGDGKEKTRVILVKDETDTYLEGFDLQDLEAYSLALLEADIKELDDSEFTWEFLVDEYDLNMFKRFLKSKIVGTVS